MIVRRWLACEVVLAAVVDADRAEVVDRTARNGIDRETHSVVLLAGARQLHRRRNELLDMVAGRAQRRGAVNCLRW